MFVRDRALDYENVIFYLPLGLLMEGLQEVLAFCKLQEWVVRV